ncbi:MULTISPECIES: DUF4145 domain-containing protein [Vibrio]|uniref:DUF4145 domain-containing protein n=1 Tax=Vibrio TaxID=662 RepID=UPI0008034A4C|nr:MULTISPECIES: DUF4145 domain-containing protein [Vibrio]ANP65621.1 hypothetical protein BAU10_11675 [Vibrio alginolyticus]EGQ7903744.1 DUF4145 domain-containing protein [Vibrio alginolyticus]EGQ7905796.1 DUF4145 domain-containing protein [Vibrio alginolyticus]MCG9618585.1 DUF4145 domain-containing protein [Vibrio diabolicus]MCR9595583.1 DUF4145 domain-containing protein [Vibrio alginolyticus]
MKDYGQVVDILKGESDRGAVLIAASMIDVALENLIKEKLVDSDKKRDPIFEHNGSLGTFSSKIEISYRLGLITSKQQLMFNTFRKLRNVFAHSSTPLSLDDGPIRDQLEAMFAHNPELKNLYIDAVQATNKHHNIPQEDTCNTLRSGRFLLNMVFSLEILKLTNARDSVAKIKRNDG